MSNGVSTTTSLTASRAALAGVLVLGLAGCLGGLNEAGGGGISRVTLRLTVGSTVSAPAQKAGEKVSAAPLSGVLILVQVSAPDLTPSRTFRFENVTIDTATPTILRLDLPTGPNRTFSIAVYAPNGTALLEAISTTSLGGGEVTIALPLQPAPVIVTVSSGPPAIQLAALTHTPADLAWNVPTTMAITAVFDRPLKPETVPPAAPLALSLTDSQGTVVVGTAAYNAITSTITFTPAVGLLSSRTFTALVSATIADTDGRTLGRSVSWSFRTGAFSLASLVSVNVSAGAGGPGKCAACHRAAIGPDGRIHVAWSNETRETGLALGTLYYKNARTWLESFLPDPPRVISSSPELGKQPDLAVGTGGTVTIVWRDQGLAGLGAGLASAAKAVEAIVLDISQPLPAPPVVYAGTAAGVIKSSDGGKRWVTKNTGLASVNNVPGRVYALAPPSPTPSSPLYAGTTDGIFKSTDQGDTWSALNSGLPAVSIRALLIHPTLFSILYAGTDRAGVFRSQDGGATWLPVNTGLTDPDVRSLVFDPTNPAILYAGTARVGGVFKSLDQGNHWTQVGSPATGLIEPHSYALVVDPVEPSVVYVGTDQGVFQSRDGGATWTIRSTGMRGPVGLFPGVLALVLHPTIHTTVYSGGGCCSDGVYRTPDQGGQWKPSNSGLSPAHIHAIAIDLRLPSVVYAGATQSAAGVYISVDGGDTWKVSLGTNMEIFASRSTDNGQTFTAPTNLSQTPGYSDTPRVAGDGANTIHVVWRDDGAGAAGSDANAEIVYNRSSEGTVFSPPMNLSSSVTPNGLSMQPSLAVVGATLVSVVVVWQEDGEEVYLARSSDRGETFSKPVNVSRTTGPSDSPKVALDSAGTIHVVWRDETYGNSEVLYARSTDTGKTFSTPKNLSDSPGFSALPDLAVSGRGPLTSVYVVWRDVLPDRNAEIFLAESADAGLAFSQPVNLSGTPGSSTEPHLIVDAGPPERVYLSWREDIGETADGTGDLEIVMGRLR